MQNKKKNTTNHAILPQCNYRIIQQEECHTENLIYNLETSNIYIILPNRKYYPLLFQKVKNYPLSHSCLLGRSFQSSVILRILLGIQKNTSHWPGSLANFKILEGAFKKLSQFVCNNIENSETRSQGRNLQDLLKSVSAKLAKGDL